MKSVKPCTIQPQKAMTKLSGLEPLIFRPEITFINVGTNQCDRIKKFERLIKSKDYQTALEVALQQVNGGAQVLTSTWMKVYWMAKPQWLNFST
jgi:cobalamin-dependent methionine synthase I